MVAPGALEPAGRERRRASTQQELDTEVDGSAMCGNRKRPNVPSGALLRPHAVPRRAAVPQGQQSTKRLQTHCNRLVQRNVTRQAPPTFEQQMAATGVGTPVREEQQAVLLYYAYVPLAGQEQQLAAWMKDTLSTLHLRGRVRVAGDGVNVTIAGSTASLRAHMTQLKELQQFRDVDIDFKLAASGGPLSDRVAEETGFCTLAVRVCKELVSLGPLADGRADPSRHSAPHLSPYEFHASLLQAAPAQHPPTCQDEGQGGGGGDGKAAVLVDARNVYETRIGHFDVPGVPLLDPRTRCFSELPAWLEQQRALLANKRIFMYCTGGVRCERASAYVRELGPEFQDVYQLHGGIQRYLEAFPNGGLFQGKNFVYDDRVAVGPAGEDTPPPRSTSPPPPSSSPSLPPLLGSCDSPGLGQGATAAARHGTDGVDEEQQEEEVAKSATAAGSGNAAVRVVGRCAVCRQPWDDYSARVRCRRCRLLLLVCSSCCSLPPKGRERTQMPAPAPSLLCELCTEREQHSHAPSAASGAGASSSGRGGAAAEGEGGAAGKGGARGPGKLRILCLHGFRHTATTFQARSRGFLTKLSQVADLHCLDAPFLLPFYLRAQGEEDEGAAEPPQAAVTASQEPHTPGQQQEECAQHHQHQIQQQRTAEHNVGGPPLPTDAAVQDEALRIPHCPLGREEEGAPVAAPIRPGPRGRWRVGMVAPESARRRAWMVSPEVLAMQPQLEQDMRWEAAPAWVDPRQHLHQTEGWSTALQAVQRAVREHGPFDGVLGFSQGAGIATLLCAHQQLTLATPPSAAHADEPTTTTACPTTTTPPPFRFAILISGYVPPGEEAQALLGRAGVLRVPSLHIYSSGADGQAHDNTIGAEHSKALSELFSSGQRSVHCHGAGHTLPGNKPTVAAALRFLAAFTAPQHPLPGDASRSSP